METAAAVASREERKPDGSLLRPPFVAAGRQLLDEVFRPDVIEPQIRGWSAQIQPYLGPFDLFAFDPQLLIDRVAGRHEDFQEEIAR